MPSVPSFELFTRIGFAARGVMYVLIGYFALRWGQAEEGTEVLGHLAEGSGKLLLALMAIGFVAYGVWRVSEALIDSEGHGSDAKGRLIRTGGVASGHIHLGLAFVSAKLAFGNPSGRANGAEEGAATALALPGGMLLVTIAGAALIAGGIWQVLKGVRGEFLHHLERGAAGRPWVKWLGRGGYIARGIVFLLMGWFLLGAGMDADPSKAGGMADVLTSLPAGLSLAVALGLLLFGLFSFVEAVYRRINDPQVLSRLKAAV